MIPPDPLTSWTPPSLWAFCSYFHMTIVTKMLSFFLSLFLFLHKLSLSLQWRRSPEDLLQDKSLCYSLRCSTTHWEHRTTLLLCPRLWRIHQIGSRRVESCWNLNHKESKRICWNKSGLGLLEQKLLHSLSPSCDSGLPVSLLESWLTVEWYQGSA